jgi:hypothetical protein
MQNEDILDFFEDFEEDVKVVVAKYFYFHSQASLYSARLKEIGIKSFISNSNVSTAIPLGQGGIGLHVREEDLAEAIKVIKQLDQQSQEDGNYSYKDADQEEIEYLKQIHTTKQHQTWVFWLVLFLVLGIILVVLFQPNEPLKLQWRIFPG